jgi:hypothetical protein
MSKFGPHFVRKVGKYNIMHEVSVLETVYDKINGLNSISVSRKLGFVLYH